MDTEGYVVLRSVLCSQTLELLKIQTKMVENIECFKINEKPQSYPFGDNQCTNSFAKYSILCYESLLLLLQDLSKSLQNLKFLDSIFVDNGSNDNDNDKKNT